MGISAISSTQVNLTALNQPPPPTRALAARPQAVPASSSAATAGASPTTSTATPSTVVSPASKSGNASSTPAAGSAAGAQSDATLAAVYTTSVKGTSYSGSVDESDGTYTASVPSLTGASATGSSIQSAENSLTTRVDELA